MTSQLFVDNGKSILLQLEEVAISAFSEFPCDLQFRLQLPYFMLLLSTFHRHLTRGVESRLQRQRGKKKREFTQVNMTRSRRLMHTEGAL